MFLAGSGFDKDPRFPWAEAILRDASLAPDEKIEHLYATAMTRLKQWLL